MPVKIARSTPRPSFGLRELLVASHISRLASRDAAKSLLSTLVSESSGEYRLKVLTCTAASLALLGTVSHADAWTYTYTTIDFPSATDTFASGINNAGQV